MIPAPIKDNGSILFRAALYFLIPFVFSMAKQLSPYADEGKSPYWLKWIVMLLLAIGPSLIALRAYYDGSAEKHKQEKEQKNEKGNGVS